MAYHPSSPNHSAKIYIPNAIVNQAAYHAPKLNIFITINLFPFLKAWLPPIIFLNICDVCRPEFGNVPSIRLIILQRKPASKDHHRRSHSQTQGIPLHASNSASLRSAAKSIAPCKCTCRKLHRKKKKGLIPILYLHLP